jgi:hypothetical protein
MTEPEFWKSTAFAVIQAFNAAQENMSRLAYRTAIYQRMAHKHLPKNEDAIFAKAKPKAKSSKPMSLQDQRAMFKFLTAGLPPSKEKH